MRLAIGNAKLERALRDKFVLARDESTVLDRTTVLSDDIVGSGEVAEMI